MIWWNESECKCQISCKTTILIKITQILHSIGQGCILWKTILVSLVFENSRLYCVMPNAWIVLVLEWPEVIDIWAVHRKIVWKPHINQHVLSPNNFFGLIKYDSIKYYVQRFVIMKYGKEKQTQNSFLLRGSRAWLYFELQRQLSAAYHRILFACYFGRISGEFYAIISNGNKIGLFISDFPLDFQVWKFISLKFHWKFVSLKPNITLLVKMSSFLRIEVWNFHE